MTIRKAQDADLQAILAVYEQARQYMRENGNPTQWGNTNPAKETVCEDIRRGECFVGVDEENQVHMAFAFIVGDDPTYRIIENGAWKNDAPYGTIHRLGSDGTQKGAFADCVRFCETQMDNIRADTHRNNHTMQHLLEKHGFEVCGIIHVGDGSERIAYQKQTGK